MSGRIGSNRNKIISSSRQLLVPKMGTEGLPRGMLERRQELYPGNENSHRQGVEKMIIHYQTESTCLKASNGMSGFIGQEVPKCPSCYEIKDNGTNN